MHKEVDAAGEAAAGEGAAAAYPPVPLLAKLVELELLTDLLGGERALLIGTQRLKEGLAALGLDRHLDVEAKELLGVTTEWAIP